MMFWELQEANASKLEGFRRDYGDTTKRLTQVIRDYGLGLNVMAAHRAARRLGLPTRIALHPSRRRAAVTVSATVETIQAERARLTEQLKALDRREANLRVEVRPIAGGRVSISGLDEHPLTVHRDQVLAFVQGGGLGKLRDLVEKEKESPCCD